MTYKEEWENKYGKGDTDYLFNCPSSYEIQNCDGNRNCEDCWNQDINLSDLKKGGLIMNELNKVEVLNSWYVLIDRLSEDEIWYEAHDKDIENVANALLLYLSK